jgi:hypothetical protein
MHFFDRAADVLRGGQAMVNEKATNDENAFFSLDLATHVARECSLSGPDIPRCQRGGKGALQSGGCGRHHIIKRGRARFFDGSRIQAVVFGDRSMNAEGDGRRLCGQERSPYCARLAFDFPLVHIGRLGHRILLARILYQIGLGVLSIPGGGRRGLAHPFPQTNRGCPILARSLRNGGRLIRKWLISRRMAEISHPSSRNFSRPSEF